MDEKRIEKCKYILPRISAHKSVGIFDYVAVVAP